MICFTDNFVTSAAEPSNKLFYVQHHRNTNFLSQSMETKILSKVDKTWHRIALI